MRTEHLLGHRRSLVHLAFVAWGGDLLAKVGQAPFLLVAGARARTAENWRPCRGGVEHVLVRHVDAAFVFSFEANVDTIFVAGYLLACYFLVRFGLGDVTIRRLLGVGFLAAARWEIHDRSRFRAAPPARGSRAGPLSSDRWSRRLGHLVTVGLGAILLPGYFYAGIPGSPATRSIRFISRERDG
ncbi:MAG: hypothetical protein U0794_21710 [Isosphaeraceae bacterium]